MTYAELTRAIDKCERQQAAGNETSLWGLYIDHTTEKTGAPAHHGDDQRLDVAAPQEEVEWWLKAYELQGRLLDLPQSVSADIFDGDWGVSLESLEDRIASAETAA